MRGGVSQKLTRLPTGKAQGKQHPPGNEERKWEVL